MEPYTCPSSSETSTENQIDELPAWSGTEEIPESIIDVAGDKLIIPCSKSTTLDILSHDDEVLPCCDSDDESSSSMEEENEEEVLWEMINVGLQKIVSTDHLQDYVYSWSIYKVEQNLKKVHEESTFHPKLISIGPFHHKFHNKSEHLKLIEKHKWRFFLNFLESMKLTAASTGATTTSTNDNTIIMTKKKHFLVDAMKKLEAKARDCYSETFDALGSNEFVQMMLLDGCFIIQLLLLFKKSGRSCRSADDPMYTWRSTLPYLRHDLLLLENQLPFFVLHELFAMSGIDKELYTDLILDFFNPVLYREKMVLDDCKKQLVSSNDKAHLLEFFMSSFQTTKTVHQEDQLALQVQEDDQHVVEDSTVGHVFVLAYHPENIPNDTQEGIPYYTGHRAQDITIHCVTELREAGIEFKKSDDHHDLLHIEFKEGKLHIPTLFIDENTVPVLLNFIAYEQRHHRIKPYFTSYLMFLDYLVNSSKDVEHLHYKGIINHGLGSDEEVATLFNKLCKEVVQDLGDDNYLSKVFAEVNKYFGKRWNRSRAAWKHEYFRTPWAFSSFLAAVVLLILTFLQTYFTVYAYFRPSI